MSRHNEHTLKDAIDHLLKVYKLDDKLAEKRLIASWESIMGKMIAKHTSDLAIRNKHLYVTLDSSALRNELSMAKTKIIQMMNEAAGKELILDVVLR